MQVEFPTHLVLTVALPLNKLNYKVFLHQALRVHHGYPEIFYALVIQAPSTTCQHSQITVFEFKLKCFQFQGQSGRCKVVF